MKVLYALERAAKPRFATLTGWTDDPHEACYWLTAEAARKSAHGFMAGAHIVEFSFDAEESSNE